MAPVRFRKLYEVLGLRVVGRKDGTLEVIWGGGRCSSLRGRGRKPRGTTAAVPFRAMLPPGGGQEVRLVR